MKSIILLLCLTSQLLLAQVGIGTNTPEASSILELSSTSQGFMPPRMTYAQMKAIANPAEGLLLYCTDCAPQGLYYFDGSYFLNSKRGAVSGNLDSFIGSSIVHSGGDLFSGYAYTTSDGLVTSISFSGWSGNYNHNPINFQSTGLLGYQATLNSFVSTGLLEDGLIPDGQLSTSSNFSGFSPRDGRLNRLSNGSWIAAANNTSQWYKVDLGQIETISAVATQGRHNAAQWIETYTIEYSNDDITYTAYNGGQVFTGNNDQFTVVRNDFSPTFSARYVRFHPQMWNGFISSRFEVYIENQLGVATFQITGDTAFNSGLLAPTFNVTIGGQSLTFSRTFSFAAGLESGVIPDSQLSTSSNFGGFFPRDGRLNRLSSGSWIAGANNTSQWYKVDLGQIETISAVATQGRHNAAQWIETYTIEYSNDDITYTAYNGGQVFTGNSDSSTVVKNDFNPTFSARYVRFHPQTWNGYISSRFEVYLLP